MSSEARRSTTLRQAMWPPARSSCRGSRGRGQAADCGQHARGHWRSWALFDAVKAAVTFTDGVAVFWDADGNPVGGTAGSGAATITVASGNKFMGFAVGRGG